MPQVSIVKPPVVQDDEGEQLYESDDNQQADEDDNGNESSGSDCDEGPDEKKMKRGRGAENGTADDDDGLSDHERNAKRARIARASKSGEPSETDECERTQDADEDEELEEDMDRLGDEYTNWGTGKFAGVNFYPLSEEEIEAVQRFYAGEKRIPEDNWLKCLEPRNVDVRTSPNTDKNVEINVEVVFKNIPTKDTKFGQSIVHPPMIVEFCRLHGVGWTGETNFGNGIPKPSDNKYTIQCRTDDKHFTQDQKDSGYAACMKLYRFRMKQVSRQIFYLIFEREPDIRKSERAHRIKGAIKRLKERAPNGFLDGKRINANHPEVQKEAQKDFFEISTFNPWIFDNGESRFLTDVQGGLCHGVSFTHKVFYSKDGNNRDPVIPHEMMQKNFKEFWNNPKHASAIIEMMKESGYEHQRVKFVDSTGSELLYFKGMTVPIPKQPVTYVVVGNNATIEVRSAVYVYVTTKGKGMKLRFWNPVKLLSKRKARKAKKEEVRAPGAQHPVEMAEENYDNEPEDGTEMDEEGNVHE